MEVKPTEDLWTKTHIDVNYCHANTRKSSSCGYCKNNKDKIARLTELDQKYSYQWGFSSPKMTVQDYQDLMNKGWRRCGEYYYKPDNQKSCCQLYTIRLEAEKYQPNKKQRKIMNRFNRYLLGTYEPGKSASNEETKMEVDGHKPEDSVLTELNKQLQAVIQENTEALESNGIDTSKMDIHKAVFTRFKQQNKKHKKQKMQKNKDIDRQAPTYSSSFMISLCRGANAQEATSSICESLKQKLDCEDLKITSVECSKFGHLNVFCQNPDNHLEASSTTHKMNPKATKHEEAKHEEGKEEAEEEAKDDPNLEYTKYFDEYFPISKEDVEKHGFKHKYSVKIFRAMVTDESFDVYKRYEESIHEKAEKQKSSYGRFLCWSPLYDPKDEVESKRKPRTDQKDQDNDRVFKDEGVWPTFHGSYHMYHYLDDEVFAIGVIDITPNVISSVYFMHNAKFNFLSPGVIGAVREIEYINRIRKDFDEQMKFYLMGFYIQDCQKSIYKGEYYPSQLLCPETFRWYDLEPLRKKIDEHGYCRFAEEGVEKIEDHKITQSEAEDFSKSFFFYFKDYKMILPISMVNPAVAGAISEAIEEIFKNVGKELMPKLMFFA
ncbi:unnamed protein product [Moneuplotes crassus]|uniref:Arginyl-tRNA--protein transferase 1 n=1 Tax=Euplotes crassus TaxID=5936 RepID=A0AAD1X4V5_EUPCR|nr:unnamed protein product [Moneuplotes crassus]